MSIQSSSRALGFAVVALAVTAGGALAIEPHERNGFLIGFNLGGGSAEVEWEADDLVLSSDDRENGGAGNFRIGYAMTPEVALAFEAHAWARTYDIGAGNEATVSFSVAGPSVTWWPGGQGFFLRGTIGVGRIRVEVDTGPLTVTGEDSGLGLALGLGYEWRLTRKFALGIELDGGSVDAGEVDGGDLKANFANLTAALNWYW